MLRFDEIKARDVARDTRAALENYDAALLSVKASAPIWHGALQRDDAGRFGARLERRPSFVVDQGRSLSAAAYLATLDLARVMSDTLRQAQADWPLHELWKRLPRSPAWPTEHLEVEATATRLLIGV